MATTRGEIGPFRGLAAFGETDARMFLGRDEARRELEGLLRSQHGGKPILVTGELGCGKTSFLQAALVPVARRLDYLPFYIELGPLWEHRFRDDLSRYVGRELEPGDSPAAVLADLARTRQSRLLVVIDQLEQLAWFDPLAVRRLDELLQSLSELGRSEGAGAPPAQLVLSVDRESLHVLGLLHESRMRIADDHRIVLERWSERETAAVIEQTVLAGGGYMEAGLPEEIAAKLALCGTVLPADVQRVCHAAVAEHALTRKAFRRAGGVAVLTTLYVERLAARAGGWESHRLLAVLAEGENPAAAFAVDAIASAAGLPQATTIRRLEQLVTVGLVRALALPGQPVLYGLLHPLLRQATRDLVAPLARGRARARLALDRSNGLLGLRDLVTVLRFLGSALNDQHHARVQRSRRLWLVLGAVLLVLPFFGYGAIYARLTYARYLSSAPDDAGTPRVVVRRGDPALSFAFGWSARRFGDVERDTGIALASLPAPFSRTIQQNERDASGAAEATVLPSWFRALIEPMEPVRKAAWQLLAGPSQAGSAALLALAEAGASCHQAARLLVLFRPGAKEAGEAVVRCLGDRQPSVRLSAIALAEKLPPAAALRALVRASEDADGLVRLGALRQAVRRMPRMAQPIVARGLVDRDVRVQREAIAALPSFAKDSPLETLRLIFELRTKATSGHYRGLAGALTQIEDQLVASAHKAVAARLLQWLAKPPPSISLPLLLRWLERLAPSFSADKLLPLVRPLLADRRFAVQQEAAILLARFAPAGEVLPLLTQFAYRYQPRKDSWHFRAAAARGLGLLRGAEPKQRLKLLRSLALDPEPSVRRAAVGALLGSGYGGLSEVLRAMRKGSLAVGRAALETVCRDTTPRSAVATAVLTSAWTLKRGALRPLALSCAQKLAEASPRLALWLAYQAASATDAAIRRAAAPAVAQAVARPSAGRSGLLRRYLRDPAVEVRVAVLENLGGRPLSPPALFLGELERLAGQPEVRVRVAVAGLAARARGVALVERFLGDASPRVRRAAIDASARFEGLDAASLQRLAKALALVISRCDASDALAVLKSAAHLGVQEPVLRASSHPALAVRVQALALNVKLGAPQQLSTLLEAALRDAAPELGLAAVQATVAASGRLGAAAVTLLERASLRSDPRYRWAAFEALGQLRGAAASQAALKLLERFSTDRSEELRRLALGALANLAGRVEAAGMALLVGSRDPAHDVRLAARTGLAAFIARTRSRPEIWRLLTTSAASSAQRRTAIAALALQGRWGDPAAQARWIAAAAKRFDPARDLELRIGAALAQALVGSDEDPAEILSLVYGY